MPPGRASQLPAEVTGRLDELHVCAHVSAESRSEGGGPHAMQDRLAFVDTLRSLRYTIPPSKNRELNGEYISINPLTPMFQVCS